MVDGIAAAVAADMSYFQAVHRWAFQPFLMPICNQAWSRATSLSRSIVCRRYVFTVSVYCWTVLMLVLSGIKCRRFCDTVGWETVTESHPAFTVLWHRSVGDSNAKSSGLSQFCDTVGWDTVTESHPACHSSASTIPKCLPLTTVLTWGVSGKMDQFKQKPCVRVYVCSMAWKSFWPAKNPTLVLPGVFLGDLWESMPSTQWPWWWETDWC